MKRRIIAAVDDIFFAAKIRAAAEHIGVTVEFPRSADKLLESARAAAPDLLILDLHAQRADPFVLAQNLKADQHLRTIPIVAFFSHVQTELFDRAQNAGVNRVMPRSAFTKNLPDILQGNFQL